MKIIFSKHYRTAAKLFASLFIICIILVTWFVLTYEVPFAFAFYSFCILLLLPIALSWRGLSCILLEQGCVTSLIFGRKQCTVKLDEKVYYTVFEMRESKVGPVRKCIAVSNKEFAFVPKRKHYDAYALDMYRDIWFFWEYDQHKIVVLPYDERTKPFLLTEKWNEVRK